jgi:hypothetical protein
VDTPVDVEGAVTELEHEDGSGIRSAEDYSISLRDSDDWYIYLNPVTTTSQYQSFTGILTYIECTETVIGNASAT